MRIYGFPGERVDFVSKSGSAGSVFFGDSASSVEEFFGPAHVKAADVYTYFNGSIAVNFEEDKVTDIVITPGVSKEPIEVFVEKQKLTGLSPEELEEIISGSGISAVVEDEKLASVTFAAITENS